ncbi:hypothetical protein WS73_09790 [Burkholderia savannae]|nr:hypothetical protein WS73_09790 [Burkholderia savannae]
MFPPKAGLAFAPMSSAVRGATACRLQSARAGSSGADESEVAAGCPARRPLDPTPAQLGEADALPGRSPATRRVARRARARRRSMNAAVPSANP